MKRYIIPIVLILAGGLVSPALSQQYSLRTNVLNLAARGPSVTLGKIISQHNEVLLTYSSGSFQPFLREDYYRYATVHVQYHWKTQNSSQWELYYGGYLRYIHKRILSEGYEAGPYGIFSKAPRDFKGNGLSTGLSSGAVWSFHPRWFIDFNTLLGAGKYLSQVDYAGRDNMLVFADVRIAVQVGIKF